MEWAIVALICFQTLILAVVGILVWRLAAKLTATADTVQKMVRTVEPRVQEVVADVQRFTRTIQPIGEQLVDISIEVKRIVEISRRTTEQVADYVGEATQMVNRQTSKIDGMVTEVVKRSEMVMDLVTHTILNPIREISSVFSGVKAALGYLRGERPHRDREKFAESDEMSL